MASAEDGRETGPHASRPPETPHAAGPWASPVPDGTAAFPVRIGWGLFRWAVLLGVLVMGLGLAGSNAADSDPVVDLTVLHAEGDGRCTVSWTVPWDGTERTGPFRCDPKHDYRLDDWELGYLVSYGPWKGDLYDRYGDGTVADEVNGRLALGGFGLAGAGVIGGLTRWSLRLGRREPGPYDRTPRTATAGSPGTASAAADGQPSASPAEPRVSLVKAHPTGPSAPVRGPLPEAGGHDTPALDLPATARALEDYRHRARRLAAAGAAGVLAAAALIAVADGAAAFFAPQALGPLLVLVAIGLGSLRIARRMERTLSAHHWTACPAVGIGRTLHSATVVLRDSETGTWWPMTAVAVRQRYHLVAPGPSGVLWWCGDPRAGGVISPPGSGELVWVKPVRGRRTRERLCRTAESEGLALRPDPVQPDAEQPQSGQPRPVQPEPDLRAPEAGAVSKTRGRVPGLFRWAVLLGVLVTGAGLGGYMASETDPRVELTVHDKDSLGRCTVSWTDPGNGTKRTGPFQCDPDPDTPVGWERGWVVAHGPWKGDLYNEYGEGTAAFDGYAVLTVAGLAVAVPGFLGGGIRWTRRTMAVRRAVPAAYGPGAPVHGAAAADGYGNPFAGPAGGSGAPGGTPPRTVQPSYAVLAAEAERQALPRPAKGRWRPEADVRKVPWWRVRTLLDMSQLPPAAWGLGSAAPLAVLYTVWPEDVTVLVVLGIAAGAVMGAVHLHRALTWGVPLARRLALAARAPVPVPKRYVLLYDPYGGLPNLVLFPAHGGPDDLPEAVLTVLPPGRGKHPGLGLPAPVGEAELRGWLDIPALVVPWIEGRPLWPRHPYEELSAHDPEARALLARLTAGAAGPSPLPED
ncbi:hypothetical protein [Streptomyces albus]|uniref:hypothetical protein n=1 Tax=Streptomyces albus TaxID=1888 RepID=UPI0004C488BF|nr:hypothetical protein [Streptomyces albus]